MSNREKVIALLDSVPDYKMGYVQGITADEEADDIFCQRMWENYENDPDPENDEKKLGRSADLPGFFARHRRPWGSVPALCPEDWPEGDSPCPGHCADKRRKPSGNPLSGGPEGFAVRV